MRPDRQWSRLQPRLRRWGWLLLLAAAPAFSFITPALSPLLLVVPGLLVGQGVGRGAMRRTPLDWPLVLLLVMVLVSLWATFSIAFSLVKVAGMVAGIGLFYAVVQAGAGRPPGRLIGSVTTVHLLLGAGVAVMGLLGARISTKVPLLAALVRRLRIETVTLPGAEAGLQPNEVAGVLLWVAPLALALAASFRKHGSVWLPGMGRPARLFVGGALSLLALALAAVVVLTQSRSAWAGLAAAVVAMLAVTGRRGRWAAGAAVTAVAVGGLLIALRPGLLPPALSSGGNPLQTLESRVEIWSRALYGIQDFPFTGMGMNTFRRVVHLLYPLFLISPDVDIAHAHNQWLQAALDLGLPGLIAYAGLWLGIASMLWRVIRQTRSAKLSAPAVGLWGCLAGSFVYGLTDAVALGARPGFIWWLLLALGTLLWQRVEADRAEATPSSGAPSAAAHAQPIAS